MNILKKKEFKISLKLNSISEMPTSKKPYYNEVFCIIAFIKNHS